MKRVLLVCAGVLGILSATSASAAATTGYVCQVSYSPRSAMPEYGKFGSLWVVFNSGPHCTGSSQGALQVYSIDATEQEADSRGLYSEAGLLAFYKALLDAMTNGSQVYYTTSSEKATTLLRAVFRGYQ